MALGIWSRIIIVYLAGWTIKLFTILLNKDKRQQVSETNDRLNELRQITAKTVEEQKEFIELLNPKTPPFEWSLQNIFKTLKVIIIYLVKLIPLYLIYNHVFNLIGYDFSLFGMVLFLSCFNIITNFILKRWNLQGSDITRFF